MEEKTLAQIGFEAFWEKVNLGDAGTMLWADQSDEVRAAWEAAAEAIKEEIDGWNDRLDD